MNKLLKNNVIYLIGLLIVVIFTFANLSQTFYQQDEWQTLGHLLIGDKEIFGNLNPILLLFGELRPLSGLLYSVLLGVFRFSIMPAAIFGIFFHFINAILTFYLAYGISKNKLIAFLAGLFLITNSVSHQAVTWIAALGTLPATTFLILTVICYFQYFETKDRKFLTIGFVSTVLSLMFKGVGLFLFIFLPIMFFIYEVKSVGKRSMTKVVKTNFLLLVFGSLIFLVRSGQFFFSTKGAAGFINAGSNSSTLMTIIGHIILYPLTSLFQIFVPPLDLYSITIPFSKMQYRFLIGSPLTDLVAQSMVADMFAIVGSMVIIGFLVIMALKYKNKILNKNILFSLLFLFLSFLPYIVLNRDSSYLSSRYFYVAAIPAGIIFGYIVYFFIRMHRYAKWPVFFLVFLFLFHHVNIIRKDVAYQVKIGNERKAVLNGIKKLYPEIEKNFIFYVTSDKPFSGEITNPFQNGLGYILEVWYYSSGNIPSEFLMDNFLWDLGSEGYRKNGDFGFGYFQNTDKMVKEMKSQGVSINIIHGFLIDSKTGQVSDITKETKEIIAPFSATLK